MTAWSPSSLGCTVYAGSAPHPEVSSLTDLGWFAGTLHVPGRQRLVDCLAPGNHIVKLTRVRIPNERERLPFVSSACARVNLGRVTGIAEWANQQV